MNVIVWFFLKIAEEFASCSKTKNFQKSVVIVVKWWGFTSSYLFCLLKINYSTNIDGWEGIFLTAFIYINKY